MNYNTDYTQIEKEIGNISEIINNEQIAVNKLSVQCNNKRFKITRDFEKNLKEKQINLIRIIKQKIILEDKLQSIHEERYNEFEKSNVLDGVNDVIKLTFQYAHPIDKRTKKYMVNNTKNTSSNDYDKKYIITLNIVLIIYIIVYIYYRL